MTANAIDKVSISGLSAFVDKQTLSEKIANTTALKWAEGILISRFIGNLFYLHGNTYKSLLIILLGFFLTLPTFAATCLIDKNLINVTYDISQSTVNTPDQTKNNRLHLIRYKGKVAYHYPNKQMTKIWAHTSNHKVKSIHYYDNEKRAIEFEPNDLKMIKPSTLPGWSQIYQLIDQELLDQFALIDSNGKGCDREQEFKLVTKNQYFTLVWLPELAIIKSLSIKSKNKENLIELTNILTGKVTISDFFEEREQYQSTDFADIGDNETDEFLLKRVNLGFTSFGYH